MRRALLALLVLALFPATAVAGPVTTVPGAADGARFRADLVAALVSPQPR